jgi:hypothetical protein
MSKTYGLFFIFVSTVACTAAPKKIIAEENKSSKASDSIKNYDGKAIVQRVGEPVQRQEITFSASPRYLVYVTLGRNRAKPKKMGSGKSVRLSKKVPKAFVIVDGSASTFRKHYKKSDYRKLKGSVQSVSQPRFDEILRELQNMGFKRLEGQTKPIGGSPVGTERAIHLEIDGKRLSLYKSAQLANGSEVSPRAIFTRTEEYIAKAFFSPRALANK